MKKFLSLVLSLVMTMSLVTVGAGATEYKDFADKGEVQYEEAVAVLNKLGIITGYEDGSFKPTGALTRGAAAKIIVSLMIGSEAASNLTVTAAPYKDVAVTNTFAGVISYCKTAGYINGYADGTFRPTAALTGFAFAKMLLGAVGYRGDVEGFTGSGWTMNVARLGNQAGLFDDFATAFQGNNGVTREAACLLALNTLKATEVEYTANGNNLNVNANGNITGASTNYVRSYVTSRNDNINQNISKETSGNASSFYTLEFGEEHFPDLKLDNIRSSNIADDYGRPANQWSYKNVKIGTYGKTADYSYTASASGDTNTDKVKDMGLDSYEFNASTTIKVNGKTVAVPAVGKTTVAANAQLLVDAVKNGNKVEVYLSDTTANLITNVVIVETQIMQVNRVTSKDVTLKTVEKQGLSTVANAVVTGNGVNVSAVEDDDNCYDALKGLKADDFVVVTPLTTNNGSSYSVDAVFIPTTVSGNITKVKVNSANDNTDGLTVAGTDYKTSFNWTAEDADGARYSALNGTSVSTRQESTVYLDSYGFAIYVANVKASTSYFMYDETYANVVDGRIHHFAQGWDTKGNAVSLDFGTSDPGLTVGNVYAYKTASSNSNADYQLDGTKQANVLTGTIAAGNTWDASKNFVKLGVDGIADPLIAGTSYYYKSDVKYIFTTYNGADIDSVTVKDGAQKVTGAATTGTDFSVVLNDDSSKKVIAIFVKNDNDVEVSQNVLYIQKQTAVQRDSSGKDVSIFTAYIDGVKTENLVANKLISDNTFYTYSVNDSTGVYTVNAYTQSVNKTTSVLTGKTLAKTQIMNKAYIAAAVLGTSTDLNIANATVIDLRTGGTISSASDMVADNAPTSYTVSIAFNNSTNSSSLGRVSYVFITDATSAPVGPVAPTGVTAVKAGTAYSVNYTGATVPTVDQALAAIQAAIVADGYTIKGISYSAPTYTFSVAKTVGGFEVAQPDFTFNESTGIVRLYAVAAPAITSPVTGSAAATYPAADFSVVANKTFAKDDEVVTLTITYNGTVTDADDTFTFTSSATSGADTFVDASGAVLTGIAPGKTWTCTFAVNVADVVAPVVAIAATTV